MELGFIVMSVTSDRNRSLVSAVKSFYPHIPHQYCTVHIQRRCQSLLTRNPETNAGKDLLVIVKFVNQIKSNQDKKVFLAWLNLFENRYKNIHQPKDIL